MKLMRNHIIGRLVLILTWCFFLAVLPSFVAGKVTQKRHRAAPAPSPSPTPTPTPEREPVPAIPVSEILAQAEEFRARLEELSNGLAPSEEITRIERTLDLEQQSIELRQRETDELLTTSLNLAELGELENEWKSQKSQYAAMQTTLAARIKTAENDIKYIDGQMVQWENVLQQVQGAPELETISKKAQDSLTNSTTTRSKLNESISNLLALQKEAFQQDEIVTTTLGKIAQGKTRFRRGIWEADSPPLWKLPRDEHPDVTLRQILHRSLRLDWLRATKFFNANPAVISAPLLLFFVLSIVGLICRRRVPRWSEQHREVTDTFEILSHPFSLSLLIALTVTILFVPGLPRLFRDLILLLFIAPILQFVPALIKPAWRLPLYALLASGLTISLWNLIRASPTIELSVMALLTLISLSVIGWLSWRAKKLLIKSLSRADKIIFFAINTGLLLLFVSFLGILLGYITMSQVFRSGAILGAYYAVALFAVFTSITGITALVWALRREKTFSTLRQNEKVLAKWGKRLLGLSTLTLWLSGTLKLFAARDYFLNTLSSLLTSSISIGSVHFTLGDILTFVLLFILGVVGARVIGAILREDVLVKLHLQPGLPYAISTIVYYLLLLVGFLLALSAAGVELSRFTLLTGAFGVGAGFGMQNIVNNFISGIILLFERPIRVGDIANIGTAEGEVEGIGTRACRLRNWDGAMVIVPNSVLISDPVINWSLVGKGRRVTLRFKADFSADRKLVIKVLTSAAASHPDVLPSPAPVAIFLGYGESSLEFDLLFWVPLDLFLQLKSDVAMRVSEALSEAGIKVPIPQRELLVRSDDSPVKVHASEQDAEK